MARFTFGFCCVVVDPIMTGTHDRYFWIPAFAGMTVIGVFCAHKELKGVRPWLEGLVEEATGAGVDGALGAEAVYGEVQAGVAVHGLRGR